MAGSNGHKPNNGQYADGDGTRNGHKGRLTRAHGREPQQQQGRELDVARTQALDAAQRYGVQVDVGPPHEGLLEAFLEACGLVEFWRQKVAELKEPRTVRGHDGKEVTFSPYMGKGPGGSEAVHPFVEQHRVSLELKAKMAVWCIKAGIEERRLKLEAARAEALLATMREAMADINMTPVQQKALLQAFGERIRQLVA